MKKSRFSEQQIAFILGLPPLTGSRYGVRDFGIWGLARREKQMLRKRYSVEQIINHLREAEVLLTQGQTVGEICRRIGVSEQGYYRWRRENGGLKVDQARRLKELEQENTRLKRAVADLTLDKLIL